jgi:hypothetical protein
MKSSDLHAIIREGVRSRALGDAPAATDGEETLSSAARLAVETWRGRLRRASAELVAPSGSLNWMAPALPGELAPKGV